MPSVWRAFRFKISVSFPLRTCRKHRKSQFTIYYTHLNIQNLLKKISMCYTFNKQKTVVYISHSLLITATFPPVFLLNQYPFCYFITSCTKHAVSICCLLIMSKQNSNFQCVKVFCKTKQNYWQLSTLMQLFHIKVYHTIIS